MLEDSFVIIQLVHNSNSFGVVEKALYYYFQNPASICNIPSIEAAMQRSCQASDNIIWILDYIHKSYGAKFYKYEIVMKYVPRRILVPIMTVYKNYPIWKQTYHSRLVDVMKTPYLSWRSKIQYFLICIGIYPLYK